MFCAFLFAVPFCARARSLGRAGFVRAASLINRWELFFWLLFIGGFDIDVFLNFLLYGIYSEFYIYEFFDDLSFIL